MLNKNIKRIMSVLTCVCDTTEFLKTINITFKFDISLFISILHNSQMEREMLRKNLFKNETSFSYFASSYCGLVLVINHLESPTL